MRRPRLQRHYCAGTWRFRTRSAPPITAQKLGEAELLYKAEHDALTGLANRARLDRALGQALARRSERPPAVLLVDLDGFKAVNDTHGHAAGDALLAHLARRFAACQRKEDLVCRIGGDEFAWLVSADRAADLNALAARIIAAASTPVEFGQLTLSVGCSIGIAIAGAGEDATTLCTRADKALYAVKRGGKNNFLVAD